MKRISSFMIILFFLLMGFNTYSRADNITIGADIWCPINCEPNSSEPGVMVEIAQEVFSEAGHNINYKTMPWARAIANSREGLLNGIIGANVGDAPDFIFPENELLMVSANTFFVTKNSKWHYNDVSSLSKVQLGAIIAYDYGELINDYIKKKNNKVQVIGGEDALQRNIKKILIGRIDVIIEASPVFWYSAKKLGVQDNFKEAGQASEAQKCYIAFSPSISKSKDYAKILSDGVEKLRRTKQLNKILFKYGLIDSTFTKK